MQHPRLLDLIEQSYAPARALAPTLSDARHTDISAETAVRKTAVGTSPETEETNPNG